MSRLTLGEAEDRRRIIAALEKIAAALERLAEAKDKQDAPKQRVNYLTGGTEEEK